MNSVERYVLRKLLEKAVRQGGQHMKILELFTMIRLAVHKEYTEDNAATQEQFLQDLFTRSIDTFNWEKQ